ncbi:MAG TPA: EAL domain-containing protein [Mariprofundaceae bacterium]|nr:EAL domain-containing protein [Mariprofundaceae bacterium]
MDARFDDPYGEAAGRVLRPLQRQIAELAMAVSNDFYDELTGRSETARILNRLTADGFARLKQSQARHVMMLLDPDLTQKAHRAASEHVGLVHAMVGLDILWLVEAYTLYQNEIYTMLRDQVPDAESREMFMRILSQRILRDQVAQVSSYRQLDMQVALAFTQIDYCVMSASNLPDLERGILDIVCGLEGGISGFVARPDAVGQLQIVESHGSTAERYQTAMEAGDIPWISIDPDQASGMGPGGRAWRSGEIIVSDAWNLDADTTPWRKVGLELGFRASAAVPLFDENGQSIAELSLYSAWPGYFSTTRIYGFLRHVQQVMSVGLQRLVHAPAIPIRRQRTYRRMLDEKRVVMHYQPIISLKDGSLSKLEALARLQGQDGSLIYPQRFLRALGRDELLHLFRRGLEQACADCHAFEVQGLNIQIAINFPTDGFDDARYEQALFQILEDSGLPKTRIRLEVLETQDVGGVGTHRAFIQRLRNAGIQVSQDDLGSGHSSLLRLDQYPFDEVKIDQGLVRSALRNPERALAFILYLTRLAHAFNISVTVEGLQNPGMLEAAAILGADFGQGYGIAKPMPASEIAAWYRNYSYPIRHQNPSTALGAMAGYLLWDLQLATISEHPDSIEKFVGAKAMVDEFINSNNLQDSPLDRLLKMNHELAFVRNNRDEWTSSVRAQVLEELTRYWLDVAGE